MISDAIYFLALKCRYFLIAVMHVPCYGLFALIVKLKHHFLSKWLPLSYQC